MKRGKRKSGIHIHLSNRLAYTLIAIFILAAVGVGIYAASYSASGAGHPYTEISTCGANQILKMNSAGTGWGCDTDTVGITTETDPNVASWAKPASASPPAVSGGLYGACSRDNGFSNCMSGAREPAYCVSSTTCGCRTGYTLMMTGMTSDAKYSIYSCIKN